MSTRSNIIVKKADGTYKSVYVHYDGYPSARAPLLLNHYNTQELAEKLVEPGDISVLAESCELVPGHSFDTPATGQTIYYGRDRGETGCEGRIITNLDEVLDDEENSWCEWAYVYADGSWSYTELPAITASLNPLANWKILEGSKEA